MRPVQSLGSTPSLDLNRRSFLTGAVALAGLATQARGAGFEERYGENIVKQFRVGVMVRATGNITGLLATTPVPMDWPEQSVKLIAEEKSPNLGKVSYRELEGGVKQLLVAIPRMQAGEEANCILTYEVTKRIQDEPVGVEELVVPGKVGKELSKYLLPSPFIESNDAKIRAQAPQLIANKPNAWEQVAAIFDWVREKVKYQFAEEIKPAIAALRDGVGDCEELSSLFIAFCRANRIPARAVWVPGHTYPEFYLEDASGKGHWIPCQAAGAGRDFGRMKEDRPILQKGDNFKVPEERLPQRYVKQFLKAANAQANPEVKFILERDKS